MIDEKKILDQVEQMEAHATALLQCAIKLRKSLSPVKERTSRKGISKDQVARALAKRHKTAFKKN